MDNNKNIPKKCKLFVKRLASKFEKDSDVSCTKNGSLDYAFKDAVDVLPDGPLRQEIQANFDKYLSILRRFFTTEDRSVTVGSKYSQVEFPCNLYLKKGHNIGDKVPKEDRKRLCCHVLSKKLQTDSPSSELIQVFENLRDEEAVPGEKFSEVEDGLRLLRLSTGTDNQLVITKIMETILSKIQLCSERCMSAKKPKRAGALAEQIQHFLAMCHIRYHSLQKIIMGKGPQYEDLIAAFLSIYIDLCLLYSKKLEKSRQLSRKVCDFTSYLLSRWPDHILDVLLQLSRTKPENADIILPLVRKSLAHKPDGTSEKQYLKYMLTVHTLKKKLGEVMEDMKQAAESIKAPKDFLNWLNEEKPEVLEEMPDDRHFKGRQITKFLLEEVTEETVAQLMDLLTDFDTAEDSEIENMELNENDQLQLTDGLKQMEDFAHTSANLGLFYLDTKGTLSKDQGQEEEQAGSSGRENEKVVDDDVADEDILHEELAGMSGRKNEIVIDDVVAEDEDIVYVSDDEESNDVEQIDDVVDVIKSSAVQDTITEVQETLKNSRMTRHARKLFELSDDLISKEKESLRTPSPKRSKQYKTSLKEKNAPSLLDIEKMSEIDSVKSQLVNSPERKCQVKKSSSSDLLSESNANSSILINTATEIVSDSESENDIIPKSNLLPEISAYLKATPREKMLKERISEQKKTTPATKSMKGHISQSDVEVDEMSDLMSPIVSKVKVQSSGKATNSLVKGVLHSTRLRTRSLTETVPNQSLSKVRDFNSGSDSDFSAKTKLKTRKSVAGCQVNLAAKSDEYKNVDVINSQQASPCKSKKKKEKITERKDEIFNLGSETDLNIGGYSLRQTRKRTSSEASHSSLTNDIQVYDADKSQSLSIGSKKNKTHRKSKLVRMEDVDVIEMSDSSYHEEMAPDTRQKGIDDVDMVETSDSANHKETRSDTKSKRLMAVDHDVSFNLSSDNSGKTASGRDNKKDRRKSEPGSIKVPPLKELSTSSKTRRYSLRHK